MKRALIPPHRDRDEAPPLPPDLYREPENDIELLGEMLHDVETMADKLRRLPFERDHYRADLRIVRGAAVRMADRCARLLDEVAEAKQAKVIHEERTAPEAYPPEEIQESVSRANASARFESGSEGSEAGHPPQNSQPTRKNGRRRSTAVPIEGGLKTAIVTTLKSMGPMTSTELAEVICKDSGAVPKTVHETLARMRVAKEVISSQLGQRLINRLP